VRPPSEPGLAVAMSTSSSRGSIAVARDGEVVRVERFEEGMVHGREVVERLARALRSLGLHPQGLDLVIADVGPGSYTGMRVGVTSAKLLAYACGVPVVGVPAPDAIARNLPPAGGTRTVILDAKRREVYRATYRVVRGELERSSGIDVVAADRLEEIAREGGVLLGDAVAAYAGALARAPSAAPEAWIPRAETVLALGLARARAGEATGPEALLPLYVRSPSAVVRPTRAPRS